MKGLLKKANRTLYIQLLCAALAFITMAVLSYAVMSGTVRESLSRNASRVLNFAESRTSAELLHARTALDRFSETVRARILRGDTADMLKEYINNIAEYADIICETELDIKGVGGYFETLPGGPVLMHHGARGHSESGAPEESLWFQLAVASNGGLVETVPSISDAGETFFTYAKCLLDGQGRRLGVIHVDMRIDALGREIVGAALEQGGYGMLANQDLLILAHPNPDFVGRRLDDPGVPTSAFTEDFRKGHDVSEREMRSYRNEASIAYFHKLPNGWYLGLVTPKEQYYQHLTNSEILLCLLGIMLGAVLIMILIRMEAARRMKSQAHWYKSILDAAPLPISVTDADMKWTFVNKAYETMLGRNREEVIGRPCGILNSQLCGTDGCGIACAKRGIMQTFDYHDGLAHQVDIGILRDLPGEISGFVEVVQDITEVRNMTRRQMEMAENISHLEIEANKAFYDPLTGIRNRRFFDETLQRLIRLLSRSGGVLSLMMIDVDFFKRYNDTYGHVEGDTCLKIIAETLKDSLNRAEDFVARYGGEEFVAVLPHTRKEGARLVAERLLDSVRKRNVPHINSDAAECVTVSIGVVSGEVRPGQTATDYVKRADDMLYESKRSGRNKYMIAGL